MDMNGLKSPTSVADEGNGQGGQGQQGPVGWVNSHAITPPQSV